MYLNNEIEFFDGREFMANPPKLLTENKSCYIIKRNPTATTPLGVDSYERRNIIAKGMKRFEGIDKHAPPQPPVERLSPRIICLLGMNPSPYTLNGTCCYLVGTGKRRFLIDTGENPEYGPLAASNHEKFLKNLQKTLQEEDCTLEMILVTHLHGDHFGGVLGVLDLPEVDRNTKVGMLKPPKYARSIFTIEKANELGLYKILESGPSPFDGGSHRGNWWTEDDLPDWPNNNDISWDVLNRTRSEIQQDFWYSRYHHTFYTSWVDDSNDRVNGYELTHGEILKVEGATLRCIHSPGHSENHAAFVIDEEHSIFSGDNVLGYGTTQYSDLYDYMGMLAAFQRYQPIKLFPGHGGYISDGKGLLDRYYVHRQEREDQVYDWLIEVRQDSTMWSAMDIAKKFYTNTTGNRMKFARENIQNILIKLHREGKLNCYTDSTKENLAIIPDKGYLQSIDINIVWEVKEKGDIDDIKYENFINYIYDPMISDLHTGVTKARL